MAYVLPTLDIFSRIKEMDKKQEDEVLAITTYSGTSATKLHRITEAGIKNIFKKDIKINEHKFFSSHLYCCSYTISFS